MNSTESSLVLVKPDGVARGLTGEILRRIEAKGYRIDVARGLTGEILRRIEAKGYRIEALRMLTATDDLLTTHYAEHAEKAFFAGLLEYMKTGPVVAIVIEGERVVEGFRSLAGATNPTIAAPGTIRGDLGRDWGNGRIENLVHGSDSTLSAEREIAIWFPELA